MDTQIHSLKEWTDEYGLEEFLETANARPLGLKSNPDFHPLLREIRALVPVDGDDWVKDIDVTIEPGRSNHQGQHLHHHNEWTAVFYVSPSSPIEVIEGGDQYLIQPEPGDVVVMPPGIEHRATANKSDEVRLSFAMLVEGSIASKFSS